MNVKSWLVMMCVLLLAGCAGSGGGTQGVASGGKGRYTLDKDGYPDGSIDVSNVPDAVPKVEPLAKSGNRPTYQVWGKTYHVMSSSDGYADTGRASFYGTKFQGYATASGETYDMYKMSAAHKSLPLPTYARVTNLDNQRSVIVKVNDRGPFHDDRLIDLSYAAAARLDMLNDGTARVRVEAIDPAVWRANHRQKNPAQTQLANRSAPPSTQSVKAAATRATPSNDGAARNPTLNEWLSQHGSGAQAMTGTEVTTGAGSSASRASMSSTGKPSATGASKVKSSIYLQVAALGSAQGASELKTKLESQLSRPVRISQHAALHRVQIGPLSDPIMVESVKSELRAVGYDRAIVVSASD